MPLMQLKQVPLLNALLLPQNTDVFLLLLHYYVKIGPARANAILGFHALTDIKTMVFVITNFTSTGEVVTLT